MGILTGALVAGVAGSAISASSQKSAAKSAANAQTAASNAQIEAQKEALAQTRALLQPYVDSGNAALMGQMDLLGLSYNVPIAQPAYTQAQTQTQAQDQQVWGNPFFGAFNDVLTSRFRTPGGADANNGMTIARPAPTQMTDGAARQAAAIAELENSPIFQSLVRQGEDAMLQNASATGGLRGGNIQGALAQYRPQMLNQQILQRFNQLGGLSALGQNAAAGVGNSISNTASNIGTAYGNIGAAQAGQALASGQATANAIGGITNNLTQYAMMNNLGLLGSGTAGGSFGNALSLF